MKKQVEKTAWHIVLASCFLMLFAMIAIAEPREVRTFGAIDGDTIIIAVPCNVFQARQNIRVRLWGIDTPETRRPQAKCSDEIKRGEAAKAFARSLIKRGDMVIVTYRDADKYQCRIVADVTLPDGRDGNLTKKSWCK